VGVIKGYEKPLFHELAKQRSIDSALLSFNDKERIKQSIATGREVTMRLPHGREIFGTSDDTIISKSISEKLAGEIFLKLMEMVSNSPVKIVLFTGGGVAIRSVWEHLEDMCRKKGIYPYEPRGASEGNELDSSHLVNWQSSDQDLQRIATAVGSTSVLLDLPVKERIPDAPTVPQRSNYTVCSCHGGNSLCMRCGGMGHYRTR
jgi:hypothetical protein